MLFFWWIHFQMLYEQISFVMNKKVWRGHGGNICLSLQLWISKWQTKVKYWFTDGFWYSTCCLLTPFFCFYIYLINHNLAFSTSCFFGLCLFWLSTVLPPIEQRPLYHFLELKIGLWRPKFRPCRSLPLN